MKQRKRLTTRIVLDLEDDEFLELAGMGFAVETWPVDPIESAFGRMLLKVKQVMEKKATPGQLDYLEKMVFAIQEAARVNPNSVNEVKSGFIGFMDSANDVMDVLNK